MRHKHEIDCTHTPIDMGFSFHISNTTNKNNIKNEMCENIIGLIKKYLATENLLSSLEKASYKKTNNINVQVDSNTFETHPMDTDDIGDFIKLLDDKNKNRFKFILDTYKKCVELGLLEETLDQEDVNLIEKGVM